ncbi:MAG: HAD hydrolase-like protein [Drouetiella hepatica Uher 2000/2452]|uniref:HAD hydrolase-like protein n=1 Tax=Drouetiella hepatica Uher 2000/2452 TaxID=904376 RepID=A0A951QAW3_9CYAN|nr:HAD hydrolase-like protein [Drouetiella hepatica Uher 2000/2452]
MYPYSLDAQFFENLTVFCDFDGPIVDVSDRYYHTYQSSLTTIEAHYRQDAGTQKTLHLNYLTKEQFWSMKQERMPDREIAMRSGLQGDQIDAFLRQVSEIVNQPGLLHQDQLQQGVKWALALLHAQGVRLVLVTLRCQEQATQILRSYGIEHLFNQIWGTHDQNAAYTNLAEQKTQLLANAIAACPHTSPISAWMIGDTEADILAGQTMGIPTIALTCGIRSQAYLQRFEPTRIHADLLSASHYLVSQMPIHQMSDSFKRIE